MAFPPSMILQDQRRLLDQRSLDFLSNKADEHNGRLIREVYGKFPQAKAVFKRMQRSAQMWKIGEIREREAKTPARGARDW